MKSKSTESKWHTVTWQTRVGGLLLLLGFVPAFSFYAGMQYQSLIDSNRAVQDLSARNAVLAPGPVFPATPASADGLGHQAAPVMPASATYLSLKQSYAFSLFKQPDRDLCVFVVNDDLGKAVDISTLVGVASIPCQVTSNGLSSGFQKWLDDTTFVIDVGGGKTLQIDVQNKTVKKL